MKVFPAAGVATQWNPAPWGVPDRAFQPHEPLSRVLSDLGLAPGSFGGAVDFVGNEAPGGSVFRMGAAAGIASAAYAVAVASLWADRTGETQDVLAHLDEAPRRLSALQHKWERLNGYPIQGTADPGAPLDRMFETRDGGWVLPTGVYPRMRSSILRILESSDDPSAIARAVRRWDARELEGVAADAGVDIAMVRSLETFLAEPQYTDHLAGLPLIEIKKTAESDPVPFGRRPTAALGEFRVLGLAKGTAGTVIGRSLAQYGADVLNAWRPSDFEHDSLYVSGNLGVRSALIDLDDTYGRGQLLDLLAGADVFYTNRRQALLDRYGLSAEQTSARSKGIIHVQISLHGSRGPWAPRVGFARSAAAVSGILTREGSESSPKPPVSTLCVDRIAGWLAAAGATAALIRRSKDGGSYSVRVSLTRVCLWLHSLGLMSPGQADFGGEGEPSAPHTFTISTNLGRYTGVADPAYPARTKQAFRTHLVPRGSSTPAWLPPEHEVLWS